MANQDINVGAISEALNNKVDLNQLNTNAQGLSYGSGWGMPSTKYVDLTLGASGTTYTAPANGWFTFTATATTNGSWFALASTGKGGANVYNPYVTTGGWNGWFNTSNKKFRSSIALW